MTNNDENGFVRGRFRLLDSGGVKWHQPPATVNGEQPNGFGEE
jgi:hypothetical protein